MKRRYIAIFIGIVALCLLAVIILRHSNAPNVVVHEENPNSMNVGKIAATSTPVTQPNTPAVKVPQQLPDLEAQKKFDDLYMTPIQFFGKVVDESGKPIEGALVKVMVADVPFSAGKSFDFTTGAEGDFALTNAHGASVAVSVAKEGYASLDKSRGMFRVGELQNAADPKMPAPGNPAVFVLQSLGKVEPLVKISTFIRVPKTGQSVEVDLSNGKVAATGQENFRVEAWTNDQAKNAQGRYSWKCKVSVPGGGLVERKSAAVFEAPVDGYQEADEINMPQDAKKWSSKAQRQYFVKLGSGQYARVQFEMIAEGDHFFSIKSYLNPKPDSRNLASNSAREN